MRGFESREELQCTASSDASGNLSHTRPARNETFRKITSFKEGERKIVHMARDTAVSPRTRTYHNSSNGYSALAPVATEIRAGRGSLLTGECSKPAGFHVSRDYWRGCRGASLSSTGNYGVRRAMPMVTLKAIEPAHAPPPSPVARRNSPRAFTAIASFHAARATAHRDVHFGIDFRQSSTCKPSTRLCGAP